MANLDWDRIKRKFEEHSDILNDIKDKTDKFISTYQDNKDWKAGWGHDFVCDYCSGGLIFNPKERGEYTCSVCSKKNKGDRKDWAWTYLYRGTSCGYVRHSGMLYNITKDEEYLKYIKEVMNFLTDNYNDFEIFSPALRFAGRYSGTGLTDAVFTMHLLNGLDSVREFLDEDELEYWHLNFFVPQADMFDFFANKIYNIPLWQKVSEANIGIFFQNESILKRAFHSRFGIIDQLRRGVTQDGMWFETSTGYHYYVLSAMAELLLLCHRNNVMCVPEFREVRRVIEKQFMFPLKIMFTDGKMANPADSTLDMDVFKYNSLYVKAAALYPNNPHFKQVLGYIKNKENPPVTLDQILYGVEFELADELPSFGSNNFSDSFCAFLQNDQTQVYLKTGLKNICHSHPDVMTMELAFFGELVSKDIGSAGYSSQIFYEWQNKTIAHNTVTINQTDQEYTPVGEGVWPEGIVESYNPTHIVAKSKNVYECVDFTRDMKLDGASVKDIFNVKGTDDLVMDYAFYCIGEAKIDKEYVEIESLGTEMGYQHLFNIKQFDNSQDITIDFELEDKVITLKSEAEEGAQLYLVNSYVNNFNEVRNGVIIRKKGVENTFNVLYSCVKK